MKIDRLNPCYAAFHADAVERLSRLPEALFRVTWFNDQYQQIAYEVLGRVMTVDEIAEYTECVLQPKSLVDAIGLDGLGVMVPKWTRSWGDRNRAVVQISANTGPVWAQIIALSLLHTGGFGKELTLEERRAVVAHEALETLNRALWTGVSQGIAQTDITRDARFWEREELSQLRPVTVQEYLRDRHNGIVHVLRRPDRTFGRTTTAGVRAIWKHQLNARVLELLPEFATVPAPTGAHSSVIARWAGFEALAWREFLAQEVVDVPRWLQHISYLAREILQSVSVEQTMVLRSDLPEHRKGK